MVDVKLIKRFNPPVSRALLRRQAALLGMELLKQGSRLSVLPCEEDAFTYIGTHGRRTRERFCRLLTAHILGQVKTTWP